MNLRTKLLLGIGIALIATFALVAIFSFISLERSYHTLEEMDVITTVTRAESSLANDKKNLRSVTRDYGAWTDTYQFAMGENPSWVSINTDNDFFERFGVQGELVFNRSGGLVFSKGYNASSKGDMKIPDEIIAEIRDFSAAQDTQNSSEGSYTIMDSSDGPIIVSSHPILMDGFIGPSAGSLHLIRKADERYLSDLSARAGRTVTIIPSPQVSHNRTVAGIISRITPSHPVVVAAESPDIIAGYAHLDNLQSPGSYYLKVSEPRTIYQSGQATIMTFIISLLGAGVFIIVFVLLFIDRVVLSRLNAIISTVRKNKETGGTSTTNGDGDIDEMSRLALEIDPVYEKLAESRVQLQQSEERYRTLAESSQDFIYIIDTKDRITYVNSFAAVAIGMSKEELIGKPRSQLFPALEGERQRENIEKVIATGKPLKIESNLPMQSGDRWADTLLVPLRDRNNVITGVMGVTRDITQRKKAEEALSQTNKKLNLLSSITRHDILNQLTALRTYLELSLDYTKDPDLTSFILKEEKIAAIIDQQISFTRDYQQMGVNAPTWQMVQEIVSWTIQPLSVGTVKVSIDCPDLEVYADPMFEKVFYNLVENALRYGGESLSQIHISSTTTTGGLIISVEDDGAGIPEGDKERIFERGFGKNTGFGLFLSREILGITGMTITETGIFGKGARFEILVPEGIYRFPASRQKS
jgi:PAS domain S-box-containing protein